MAVPCKGAALKSSCVFSCGGFEALVGKGVLFCGGFKAVTVVGALSIRGDEAVRGAGRIGCGWGCDIAVGSSCIVSIVLWATADGGCCGARLIEDIPLLLLNRLRGFALLSVEARPMTSIECLPAGTDVTAPFTFSVAARAGIGLWLSVGGAFNVRGFV